MEIRTKTFQTLAGLVEGVKVKWTGCSILLVTGSKGFLACPLVDLGACRHYGAAAAIVQSSPDNLIGTLERFAERKVVGANEKAKALGITEGMLAKDAFALIA